MEMNCVREAEVIKVANCNLVRWEEDLRSGLGLVDASDTADLEESMTLFGFTDPLEITDYGMDAGKYIIIDGHRRRMAGVKVFGENFVFPCVLRRFETEEAFCVYADHVNSYRLPSAVMEEGENE